MTHARRFQVNKLIRDRVPDLLNEMGIAFTSRILDPSEYLQSIKCKLLEEAQELYHASLPHEIREELADLLEVLITYGRMHEITLEEILKVAQDKKRNKGGFDLKIYCECVEMEDTHPKIDYYQKRPDQYPEILPEDA